MPDESSPLIRSLPELTHFLGVTAHDEVGDAIDNIYYFDGVTEVSDDRIELMMGRFGIALEFPFPAAEIEDVVDELDRLSELDARQEDDDGS